MVGGWGGYVSLVRFILQFTKVFGGVSGANWQFFLGFLVCWQYPSFVGYRSMFLWVYFYGVGILFVWRNFMLYVQFLVIGEVLVRHI